MNRLQSAERQNLVLETIRSVNRVLLREMDRRTLLVTICASLVENRGYLSAWIALLTESGELDLAAQSGIGDDFNRFVQKLEAGEWPQCVSEVLHGTRTVPTQNPSGQCTGCPLSNQYGQSSAVTLRLSARGRTFGVLSISMPSRFLEDGAEKQLIEDVGEDISIGLHRLELEEQNEGLRRELKEERDFAQLLVNTAQFIVLVLDPRGRIIQYNPYMEQLTGYRLDEVRGKHWFECFIPEEERAFIETLFSNALGDRGACGNVNSIIAKDGGEVMVEWHDTTIKDTDGSVLGLLCIGHDVTERLSAAAALHESEENFLELVENSLVGISIVQDNEIVYRNPEQIKLLGSTPMLFSPEGLCHVFPEDADAVKSFYEGFITGKTKRDTLDFRFCPVGTFENEAEIKWLHCLMSAVRYRGRAALFVNFTDVSQAKQLDHLMRIEDKMASLGRVAAGLAHEIRNPLSGINIYLETLGRIYETSCDPQKISEIINRLKQASTKIESVVRKTMDFSKPSEPKFVLTDLNVAVNEAMALSSVALRKSGIRLNARLEEGLPPCMADANMITQVLMNLITNATDAMAEIQGKKIIECSSSERDGYVVLTISDSGPGVPAHLKEKIFEPFFSRKHGGTGIGLSLSHRIVADHGGTLDVADSSLGGAEFHISIPKPKSETNP